MKYDILTVSDTDVAKIRVVRPEAIVVPQSFVDTIRAEANSPDAEDQLENLWAIVMEAIVEIDHGRATMARKISVDAYDAELPLNKPAASGSEEAKE